MNDLDRLIEIVARLRAEDGCPWDRQQTHESLKPCCIEEAAEVICGINIYSQTGNSDNLKEELGDLLLQVIMHAQIAKEEGLFDIDDVINMVSDKMVRRHPHVFGEVTVSGAGEVLDNWKSIKEEEKARKQLKEENYLRPALDEAKDLLDAAAVRKNFK